MRPLKESREMKKALPFIFLLLISACSNDGGGNNPIPPPPVITPRPGALVFTANWTPPLGVALVCGGPVYNDPFTCSLPLGAIWGVLPQEGNGGNGCIDPEPNVCFQPSGGVLNYSASDPGMALVRSETLSRASPISVEAVVTASNDCPPGTVSYVGPVIYDGEGALGNPTGNYRSEYLSCANGGLVQVWLYGPTYAGPIGPAIYAEGVKHSLRIDWTPGTSFVYYVDGVPILTETPGSKSADSLVFNHDPRPALWFGRSKGTIERFDVYSGP